MMTRSHNRGFNLVELMVAVVIASVVMLGVYSMYTSSVRGYRAQGQQLDSLGQLRMATRQIKADLRNAGYNAPGQSNAEAWVETPAGLVVSAVAVEEDPDAPVIAKELNKLIIPQRIRILGDFFSHRTYTAERVAGQTVTLRWDQAVDGSLAEFERIFNTRRMLRVETFGEARREQVIPIASASYNGGFSPTVTLTDPVQNMNGFGTGSEVSVLGYVRYRLKRDTRRDADGGKVDLIREELTPEGTAIAGTALIIAEYVVDLQVYDFCFNVTKPEEGTMRQTPVQIECIEDLGTLTSFEGFFAGFYGSSLSLRADDSNQSHLLRSLTVRMSTRTPFENEDIPFLAKEEINQPLRTYEVEPEMDGSARVTELAAMVILISIQARRQ